jgi:glycosyltransferase involved in cell wall biosynthesis
LSGSERASPPRTSPASPRFSIIITFHNQQRFIKDALDSALSQRDAEFEVVVVDDASLDGSQEILKGYADAIRLVCLGTNVGACAARNRGAAEAAGEYLVFLDGDDALLPWALDVYNRIVEKKSPAFILASMTWFKETLPAAGERPREIGVVDYGDYLRRDRGFGHSASAFVVARRAFEEAGGWLVGFFPLEDVEFAMRLGIAGRTIQILGPPTIWHRAHTGNTVNDVASFMVPMEVLLRREREGRFPGGAERRFERRALIGGFAAHWVKRAAKSGLRGKATKLFVQSAPMVFAALSSKFGRVLAGRSRVEKLEM